MSAVGYNNAAMFQTASKAEPIILRNYVSDVRNGNLCLSPVHKSTSFIDNFFINVALLDKVQSSEVIDIGVNLSDHLPLVLHLSDNLPLG